MRLWAFALALYARPGVEAACLTLQDDHEQCVPLLLWRLWALGRALDAGALRSAIGLARDWELRVLVPLRSVRRDLVRPIPEIADMVRLSLREAVKSTELAAERVLLESLEALAPNEPAAATPAATEALAQLAAAWSRPAPVGLLSHLAAAAASVTACRIAESGYGHER